MPPCGGSGAVYPLAHSRSTRALNSALSQGKAGHDRAILHYDEHRAAGVPGMLDHSGDRPGRWRDRRHDRRSLRCRSARCDGDALEPARHHRQQSECGHRRTRQRFSSSGWCQAPTASRRSFPGSALPLQENIIVSADVTARVDLKLEVGGDLRGHHGQRRIAAARYDLGNAPDGAVARTAGQHAQPRRCVGRGARDSQRDPEQGGRRRVGVVPAIGRHGPRQHQRERVS